MGHHLKSQAGGLHVGKVWALTEAVLICTPNLRPATHKHSGISRTAMA